MNKKIKGSLIGLLTVVIVGSTVPTSIFALENTNEDSLNTVETRVDSNVDALEETTKVDTKDASEKDAIKETELAEPVIEKTMETELNEDKTLDLDNSVRVNAQPAAAALDENEIVNFPDPVVYNRLLLHFAKPAGYQFTKKDLKQVRYIDFQGSSTEFDHVTTLSGLEYATNLENLGFTYVTMSESLLQEIGTLSSLKSLNFNSVFFKGTDASYNYGGNTPVSIQNDVDFSPLGKLSNLETLFVNSVNSEMTANYQIKARGRFNFEGLKNLTNLKKLDIAVVGDMHDNSAAWLSGLVNLETLSFTGSSLNSVEGIKDLPKLTNVNLTGNKITDFTAVGGKPYLRATQTRTAVAETVYLETIDGKDNVVTLDHIAKGANIVKNDVLTYSGFTNFLPISKEDTTSGSKMLLQMTSSLNISRYNYVTGENDIKTRGILIGQTLTDQNGIKLTIQTIVPIGIQVTYDENYDQGAVTTVGYDPYTPIENRTPVRAGYTFEGWFVDQDTQTPFDFDATILENVTLYAKWEKEPIKLYDVTFDSNGGSTVTSQTGLVAGSSITKPANPTKDGFTFEGWYADETLTTLWNFEADTITGHTTLYAKWNAIPVATYTVTFETNGGTKVSLQLNLLSGAKVIAPKIPSKLGNIFGGWYKDATLQTPWNFDVDTISESITLYAKWNLAPVAKFEVTFDSNGGSAVATQSGLTAGSKVVMPENPTKQGFVFDGWFMDTLFVTPWNFAQDTISASMTLYAKWRVAPVTTFEVTFDSNGGSAVASQRDLAAGSKVTKPADPTKKGFKFAGWYRDESLTTAWDFNSNTVNESLTLYAKWDKDSKEVLPETGMYTQSMIGLALVIVAIGGMMIVYSKKKETE
ncbi:hypothetical protein G7061_06690 [Erysipelothrix sp. HDW6B]|uniref:InlB B-repeat-containing protein n=1 Tax=Erysipelothrix sp. HDW6B TaxID=2714929 RepID=UPI0014074407|nr:InlB B-repeat-containing protein [Erysipelothrix sp. HDW6B]QIK86317.1 hypothetical protein G7061_06690 [Erysipelothrix sp. HDW6B]